MIQQLLAPKVLGSAAVASLAVAGGALFYAHTQAELAETRQETIVALQDTAASLQADVSQRDALIARQNAGIEALASAAKANRALYEQRFADADLAAALHDERAEAILGLPAGDLNELAQCRAARLLLEEELTASETLTEELPE